MNITSLDLFQWVESPLTLSSSPVPFLLSLSSLFLFLVLFLSLCWVEVGELSQAILCQKDEHGPFEKESEAVTAVKVMKNEHRTDG